MFTSHALSNLRPYYKLIFFVQAGSHNHSGMGEGGGVPAATGLSYLLAGTRLQGRSQTKGIILYSRFGGRGGHGPSNNYMF